MLDPALGRVQVQAAVLDVLVDHARSLQKRLLHVLPSLGAGLKEHQPVLVRKLFGLLWGSRDKNWCGCV